MNSGRRALGIAESYRGTDGAASSTLGGAVVRADRVVDDFVFGTCTVGGSDATGAIVDCWRRLDRPDVRCVFVAGVALAWYNLLDLDTIHEATGRPVVAVTFEDSEGLTDAIEDAFEGEERARRLDSYRSLPERRRLRVDGRDLFVRSVGIDADETDDIVTAYTHERRPDPLRVAKRAARRVDAFRRRTGDDEFRRD